MFNSLCVVVTVDGLAVDWVTNKVYFTDEILDIVGVLDTVSSQYAVLIRTGPNTSPRAIVLDPYARYVIQYHNICQSTCNNIIIVDPHLPRCLCPY